MPRTQTTRSSRLPRLRRVPGQAGGLRLTDRDLRLLNDLYHYRFLPTSLICRRHFGSLTRGRNRLKLLFHHGFVDRQVLPTRGPQMGEAIYSLGPAAVGELVSCYGLEPADVKRRRGRVEPFFVAHRLLISRIRMALATSGAAAGVGLYDWREEAAAKMIVERTHPRRGGVVRESITPDGIGWIRSRKVRFAFCLEADRGTMTVGRVRAKFERYRALSRQGVFAAHFGAERFRVLVVAPSARRMASLADAAGSAGLSTAWLTTEDALCRDVIFGPIWNRPGAKETASLLSREQAFDRIETAEGTVWRLPPPADNPNQRR